MTLFAPCVSVLLIPTAAAKLLQLLAFPSHALEKQAEQNTGRLSMRLLLKGRDGAHFLPHSTAWVHQEQARKQRKLFRGHEQKLGDSKLWAGGECRSRFSFRCNQPKSETQSMRWEQHRPTLGEFPFACEVTHWLRGTRQRGRQTCYRGDL